MAVVALIFGVLFFIFAARYYLATITVLLSSYSNSANGNGGHRGNNGNEGSYQWPRVSVHVPLYNEKNVARRILTACALLDYPNYEVVIADDSTDGTFQFVKDWVAGTGENSIFKIVHRDKRGGFKGGALNEALRQTDPSAKYVVVFDADFVPPPDTINKFLDYFNRHNGNGNGGNGRYRNGELAAVQGYQWHTLNRDENWLTRGVTCEYSGSYMVDRTFQEIWGTLKMVAGSVFMIRAEILRRYEWSGSLTEDWELTLRLYSDGYKVLYTPLIQAPAECPSTLGYLIRQRMRWAEGHTFNVKKNFARIIASSKLSFREKLEFLYFAAYYLQSVLLIAGSGLWFVSDIALSTRLPFWTTQFGWTLVFTNLFALPLMSAAGLFLEKRARGDFAGLFSQLLLFYALAPYQAYAALKGLLEGSEGRWFRTLKTGRIIGFLGRLELRRVARRVLPPKRRTERGPPQASVARTRMWSSVLLLALLAIASFVFIRGALAQSDGGEPSYFFTNQLAPPQNKPFPETPPGVSFLMRLTPPSGETVRVRIGEFQSSGPFFYSDPASETLSLPAGSSVSASLWISASDESEETHVQIEIYNPQTNAVREIEGAGATEFELEEGIHLYQFSWGRIEDGQLIFKGESLVASIWSPDDDDPDPDALLLFNSDTYQSRINFSIIVGENLLPLAGVAALSFGLVCLSFRRSRRPRVQESLATEQKGLWETRRVLIASAALIFLTLPLVITFNEFLTSVVTRSGLAGLISPIVPYEASAVSALLRSVGFQAGNTASQVWIGNSILPVTALIDWNCSGWQSLVLFGITCSVELKGSVHRREVPILALAGLCGTFFVNVARIYLVVLLAYFLGYPVALLFHDYGGTVVTLIWLLAFWGLALGHRGARGNATTSVEFNDLSYGAARGVLVHS